MAKNKENKNKPWQENILLYIVVSVVIIFVGGLLLKIISPEKKERKVNIVGSKLEKSPVVVDSPGAVVGENIVVIPKSVIRDEFRPLNADLHKNLLTRLKSVSEKYAYLNPRVRIIIEGGDRNRELIRNELIEILLAVNIQAEQAGVTRTLSEGGLAPISVSCHPNVFSFAKELASILNLIFNIEIPCTERNTLLYERSREGEVQVRLMGEPRFHPNGSIVFK